MATPSVIASAKASATRASVAPRLTKSAPDLASVMTAASTEATHQVTMNRARDNRRIGSFPGKGVIEGAGIELFRRPDELSAADRRQHAIENACVSFFVRNRTPRNSLAVMVPERAQLCDVGSSSQRLNALPLRVRR